MKYYKRGFLNKGDGFAAFEASLEWEGGEHSICADFRISDCNRQISLDFFTYDDESYQGALYKLELLVAHLDAFKEKLTEAYTLNKGFKDNK